MPGAGPSPVPRERGSGAPLPVFAQAVAHRTCVCTTRLATVQPPSGGVQYFFPLGSSLLESLVAQRGRGERLPPPRAREAPSRPACLGQNKVRVTTRPYPPEPDITGAFMMTLLYSKDIYLAFLLQVIDTSAGYGSVGFDRSTETSASVSSRSWRSARSRGPIFANMAIKFAT
jgi:hypothetical protein